MSTHRGPTRLSRRPIVPVQKSRHDILAAARFPSLFSQEAGHAHPTFWAAKAILFAPPSSRFQSQNIQTGPNRTLFPATQSWVSEFPSIPCKHLICSQRCTALHPCERHCLPPVVAPLPPNLTILDTKTRAMAAELVLGRRNTDQMQRVRIQSEPFGGEASHDQFADADIGRLHLKPVPLARRGTRRCGRDPG